jgi:hypothetical protein
MSRVNLAPGSGNQTRTLLPLLPHLQPGQRLGLLTSLLGVSKRCIVFLVEQFLLHNKPKASSACVIVVPPPVRTFPHHEEQDQRVLLYLSETVVGALVVVLCVVGGGEARTVGGRRTWTGLGRCHDTSGRRQVNPTWPSAR